jgi:hypothetical protein
LILYFSLTYLNATDYIKKSTERFDCALFV